MSQDNIHQLIEDYARVIEQRDRLLTACLLVIDSIEHNIALEFLPGTVAKLREAINFTEGAQA